MPSAGRISNGAGMQTLLEICDLVKMRKIIISLSVVAAVAAAVIAGTTAFFSDTEQSTGNTFTAGTIDIAVNGQNPWSQSAPFVMADMKPSQVDYTNFTINNVGTNPVNVWKKVSGVVTEENGVNEPEQAYYTANPNENGKSNIDSVIQYDLSVVVKNGSGVAQWNQTLYNMDKTITQINALGGDGTFLGMIPAGWSMDVTESYHMLADTGNWAQSDKMTFNITLTAVQLTGTAILEDKDTSNWRVKSETAPTGTLTYGVKDSKLNFSFTGVAPLNGTGYSLIMYKEPFSTPSDGPGFPRQVIVLASANSDGSGNVNIPLTSTELNSNLLNAKIWLVKSSDLSGSTMNGWNPSAYLFDTGLIDYYDSDL